MMHDENINTTPAGTRHPVEVHHPAPVVGPDVDRSKFIAELEMTIRQWNRDPGEHDLPAMDAALDDPGYGWDEPWNFSRLMNAHYIPGRTSIPCPEFCTKPAGHPFDDGGCRTHETDSLAPTLDCKEQPVMDIERHEVRDNGDDATVQNQPAVIYFEFQGDELSAVDARRIAAALTAAAGRLDSTTVAPR